MSDEGRGWEILNEVASHLVEEGRSDFVADARNLEGSFTSGIISEERYRRYLKLLSDAYERITEEL